MNQLPRVLLSVPGQCVSILKRMVVGRMIPDPGGAPRTRIGKHKRGAAFGIELRCQVQVLCRAEGGSKGLET